MKRIIILLLLLVSTEVKAQTHVYNILIQEADSLFSHQDYITAFTYYDKAVEVAVTAEQLQTAKQKKQQCYEAIKHQQLQLRQTLTQVQREKRRADSALEVAENIIDKMYFYDGKFALAYNGIKYGFIDKHGSTKIDFEFDEATPFDWRLGLAKVKYLGKYYLIDTSGRMFLLAENLTGLTKETEALDLRNKNLNTLPDSVFSYSDIKILLLGNNTLNSLSKKIGQLKNLKILDLSGNQLTTIPASIGNLQNLTMLNLNWNQLTTLPESIGNLHKLVKLDLSGNQLTTLPESIGNLQNLIELNLTRNQLTSLPESIGNLHKLVKLDLSANQLTTLPESIGNLQNLTMLNLNWNQLTTLPESIGNLHKLVKLDLSGNQLTTLPESIGNLQNLIELDLSRNKLTTLPESIGNLHKLVKLDLSANQLTTLPESIGNLQNLINLYLSNNSLTLIPKTLKNLKVLSYLELIENPINKNNFTQFIRDYDNKLITLTLVKWHFNNDPNILLIVVDEINPLWGYIVAQKLINNALRLEKKELNLAFLNLERLPNNIKYLSKLEYLNLRNNNLKSLSENISFLKNLKELHVLNNPLKSISNKIYLLNLSKQSWTELGFVLFKNHNYIQAEKCVLKAIELDSNYKPALEILSYIYTTQKKYLKAYLITKKLLKLDTTNYSYYFNLSYYSLFVGKPKEAIEAAKKTLEFNPSASGVYSNLALGYVLNNEFDKAKSIYLEWKDKPWVDDRYQTFKKVFLDDIKTLEEAGISHPDFKKVKELLNN